MRAKKAMLNSIMSLLLEAVLIVCNLILPRMILSAFGSKYNGITASITQFVTYIALLRSGIGGVTRASLYKVLSDNDTEGISSIVMATERFMRQVSAIFAALLLVFAAVYPFAVKDDFSWTFSFTLALILSVSTFSQYYFGFTYQMLLMADQRTYISALIQMFTAIANTAISVILIKLGFGIHGVKLGSAIVFTLQPLALNIYVSRRYHINRRATPNMTAIGQRWDSFAHQLANFVHGNTDIVILTILSTLEEVSVYSVYAMVITGVRKLVNNFSKGWEAAFGNMLARGEEKALRNNMERLEFIIYYFAGLCFSATAILIVPFAAVYTKDINDADYIRPVFGALMALSGLFWCLRIPYQSVVLAAGRFKETRNGAIAEPIINIVISVILVIKLGIVGVAIGTVAAMIFRTMQYALYMSENIVKRPVLVVFKKLLLLFCNMGCGMALALLVKIDCRTYASWALLAFLRTAILAAVSAVFILIFDRELFLSCYRKLKGIV